MPFKDKDGFYIAQYDMHYLSPRFKKSLSIKAGSKSDGATRAIDYYTEAWWFHDLLCKRGTWDDGTPVLAWQAALVLGDILLRDGFKAQARYWPVATFWRGCYKVREDGWWKQGWRVHPFAKLYA